MVDQQSKPKAKFIGYPGYELEDPRNPDGTAIKDPVYEWNGNVMDASWCRRLKIDFTCPEMQFPTPKLRCSSNSDGCARFYETPYTHKFWEDYFGLEVAGYIKAVGGNLEAFVEGQTYTYAVVREFSEKSYHFDEIGA